MSEKVGAPLSFLVFGVGAIGGYVGGSLALAGQEVMFIERAEVAESIRMSGLRVRVGEVERHLKEVEVVTSVQEALPMRKYDAAIVAVKSFDTEAVAESIQPVAQQFPPVLCLQNGVENEQVLSKTLGSEKVIAGTVTTAVGRGGVGQVFVEKLRGLGVATEHPLAPAVISAMNGAGLRAWGFANAEGMKWSKMLTNLLANASSAILDYSPAMIYAQPGLFRAEVLMLKEALAVMRAMEIPVIDLPATPVKALVNLMTRLPAWMSQPLLFQALGKGRGGKMPSFHIDLYAGRGKSEVDYLNGAVSRFGSKVGVATPVNDWMTRVLGLLTGGELSKDALAHNAEKYLAWMRDNQP